jgi:hypothetical protein
MSQVLFFPSPWDQSLEVFLFILVLQAFLKSSCTSTAEDQRPEKLKSKKALPYKSSSLNLKVHLKGTLYYYFGEGGPGFRT